MLFKRGDKFSVKCEFDIEILTSQSGAQGIHRKYPDIDHCDVTIDGREYFLPETLIALFLQHDLVSKLKD